MLMLAYKNLSSVHIFGVSGGFKSFCLAGGSGLETRQAPGRRTGTAASTAIHATSTTLLYTIYTPPWQAINKTIIAPASLNTREIN